MPARLVQLAAVAVMIVGSVAAGSLLPRLLKIAEEGTLRYTDVAIEGAPPIVQLGTAIGALRGIIADYLWLKVNAQKQKGLFYEIMSDAELITKLQPRFAEVWAFHGHNMAYNVSVLTNTPEERWEWVNAGIRLVREQGLRYNPNDVVLHKELAFWFAHKIDGVADDAHLYYKRELAKEWHLLLGPPPLSHADRVLWMKEIADAADTLDEAENGRPALMAPAELVERMADDLDFEVKRVRESERRDLSPKEAIALVRPLIDGARLPVAASAELVRLVQTADSGSAAVDNLRRVAAAGGELRPALPPTPRVKELVARLEKDLAPFDPRYRFAPSRDFLINYGRWRAVRSSPYAQTLGLEQTFLAHDPIFRAFQSVGDDPEFAQAWKALLAHLRKRVLIEEYNMSPQLMYEYTRDVGPLDWRHPQSHALYFARRGSQYGTKRYEKEDDTYKVLNNDRLQIQAMQALARSGRMVVDPFSTDWPTRLDDLRWIKLIDRFFRVLYDRYYETRGAGPDTFTDFHQNFMKQAVRQLYRAGDIEGAEEIRGELDKLYGRGAVPPNYAYSTDRPLDVFVQEVTFGEYEFQPDVARTDVYAALRRGFREGLLENQPRILEEAIKFAAQVTDHFKHNRYTEFVNKFGEARLGALLGDLETSVRDVFRAVLTDRSMPLRDRLIMYIRAPEAQRRVVYDDVRPQLEVEFAADPVSQVRRFEEVFPEPPGMEAYRAQQAAEAAKQKEEEGARGAFERR